MSTPQSYDAVHDYLIANWSTTPIAFENDRFEPPTDAETWLFVEVFGDLFAQESIGAETQAANLWREAGQIYVHVMTPRGAGTRTARLYASQIADLFRGQEIAGVVFRDASIGAGEPGKADGSYFRMTVTIDWQRDE
ncbi:MULTISPECIES: phage tail terminator-like protein [unclassified Ensifer]|uniref:phage tail terminator-like protein n=1 Tax=unclassified Ensifer TaxID=2633371 RepID=UPI0008136F9E|nr:MULTISPECIES: phage tail terminator-like protein [unclassified Ensifer]OCP05001.1 hypothetical protein BC362_14675 [Ensifer sp. LC14]OCP11840.1 hypothetical protein BC374_16330 [Ensifer sp. LC13]OCP12397.1 hypothetical protein BBX50_16530 [Ensifer sp. LC11]OCP33636.1 hypothetical protein BC364_15315 [Ensifer sp. LC499]